MYLAEPVTLKTHAYSPAHHTKLALGRRPSTSCTSREVGASAIASSVRAGLYTLVFSKGEARMQESRYAKGAGLGAGDDVDVGARTLVLSLATFQFCKGQDTTLVTLAFAPTWKRSF